MCYLLVSKLRLSLDWLQSIGCSDWLAGSGSLTHQSHAPPTHAPRCTSSRTFCSSHRPRPPTAPRGQFSPSQLPPRLNSVSPPPLGLDRAPQGSPFGAPDGGEGGLGEGGEGVSGELDEEREGDIMNRTPPAEDSTDAPHVCSLRLATNPIFHLLNLLLRY